MLQCTGNTSEWPHNEKFSLSFPSTELAHKLKPHSSSRGDYDVFKLQNQERIELCYRFPDYGGNVRRGGEDKSRDGKTALFLFFASCSNA